eukprot:CAMPEP_0180416630 /NCGR_PEP_ID=MMETSP1036_2-20121128/590_1 /TAXON_ID=632150 /ORGANISM="Azadinium spinosum, Strain 3D9" /LENGTH=33 /DNA_ID= /DNA_START= /DNA_END= /DNA_ORIENTATION=
MIGGYMAFVLLDSLTGRTFDAIGSGHWGRGGTL